MIVETKGFLLVYMTVKIRRKSAWHLLSSYRTHSGSRLTLFMDFKFWRSNDSLYILSHPDSTKLQFPAIPVRPDVACLNISFRSVYYFEFETLKDSFHNIDWNWWRSLNIIYNFKRINKTWFHWCFNSPWWIWSRQIWSWTGLVWSVIIVKYC